MTTHRAVPRLLSAQVLGAFRITLDERAIEASRWQHGSAERLAKLILVTPTHRLQREAAAEQLWPSTGAARAAANLRRALHFLRRAIDTSSDRTVVEAGPREIGFAPGVVLAVDLDALLHAAQRVSTRLGRDGRWTDDLRDDLEVVLRLGALELLPRDLTEEWTIRLREQLIVRWERAAVLLAERALAEGQPARAHEIAERVLERDPASEEAHRLLIRSLILAGLPHAARRQMAICRRALRDAFDIEPGPETMAALDPRPMTAVEVLTPVPATAG